MKLAQTRFVRIRAKVIYLLVGFALIIGVGYLVRPFQDQLWPSILNTLLVIVYIGFAVRSFRGAEEPVVPPRPLWRMSGGVLSGNLLGAVAAFGAFAETLSFLNLPARTPAQTPALLLADLLLAVTYGAFAVLYFHSAWRLGRIGR